MSYFEAVLETLQGIQKEMKATRHAILHQTKLLQETAENPTSAIKKTNEPEEAAPAPKDITWRAAVRYLHDYCRSVTAMECNDGTCPMASLCDKHLKDKQKTMPCNWEVPDDE